VAAVLERFELDSRGVREILRSQEIHTMVNSFAGQLSLAVRAHLPADAQGTPVVVRPYPTDRGAASVTVQDVRAMAWQARDGILTRAAGQLGAEIRAWGS
jgi:hypothetical protein